MPILMLAALTLAAQQPQPAIDQAPRVYSRPFVSPMGEPFEGKDALDQWFRQADANHDGSISLAEMQADAARFFATLDTTKDGEIDPDDVRRYETVIAPFIHVGAGGPARGARFVDDAPRHGNASTRRGQSDSGAKRGNDGGDADRDARPDYQPDKVVLPTRQGAGWFGLLNIAQPITSADTNFDRGVSPAEFDRAARTRFQALDSNHDGMLTLTELRAFLP